ncbi:VanZ family protein [Bacillus xiapuensis]|uniref:VanZ family protein n=1 Tax=Bacillus xiapuensis TaxID=2014075 RepID=A0ABU6N4R1_9BACI|nr:VanZ family protein [Bacillus xiapuensis]
MAVIWIQSSFPSDKFVHLPKESVDNTIKELLHLIEFAILYVLLVLALLSRRAGVSIRLNVACAVFAALYGVSDEIHQSLILSRSKSWVGFFKDVIGINVCFYFVLGALSKRRIAEGAGRVGASQG